MKTTISLLSVAALAIGCSHSTATPPAAQTAAPAAAPAVVAPAPAVAAAVPAAPARPMFRATYMGTDMSRPLVTTDLTPAGLAGMTIEAPEGVRVEQERRAAHLVQAGSNYSISIRSGPFSAANALSAFQALDPAGTVLVNEADRLIFQRSNNGSVLFSAGVTVGARQFTCGTVATAINFSRETVDQTIASCRTLRGGS
ncbi:MAG: hypothetical protein WCJ30_01445 [Deltaproteobacteria bacterium]